MVSIPPQDADAHLGFLGTLVPLDNPTSSTQTQQLLNWQPTHPGLIDDLDQGYYFDAPTAPPRVAKRQVKRCVAITRHPQAGDEGDFGLRCPAH